MSILTRVLLGVSTLSVLTSCGTLTPRPGVPDVAADRVSPRYQLLQEIVTCPQTCVAGVFNSGGGGFSIEFVDTDTDLTRIILDRGSGTYFGGTFFGEAATVTVGPGNASITVSGRLHDGTQTSFIDIEATWVIDANFAPPPFGPTTLKIDGTQVFDGEGSTVFFPGVCELPEDQ